MYSWKSWKKSWMYFPTPRIICKVLCCICIWHMKNAFRWMLIFVIRHMQPFSEESAQFYTKHPDIWGVCGEKEKHSSPPHSVKVFHVTPYTIKTPHCQLKLWSRPSSLPRLAQSTNRAASFRQWHSFSSTHSPCGWEAQQSVPVGSLLPSQYLFLLTQKPDHWKSQEPWNVFADTDST